MTMHVTSDEQTEKILARLYKALTHPVRLQLLRVLAEREACVCHLTALTRRPQPYVSQQLGILREAGLVADRRDGQVIYYRVDNPLVIGLLIAGQDVLRGQGLPADLTAPETGPIAGCPCPMCARGAPAGAK
jgi:DNA-binding transcriptional ArsR family regulator